MPDLMACTASFTRIAHASLCGHFSYPSFCRMDRRCVRTVATLMPKAFVISASVQPCVTSHSTSISRFVRCSVCTFLPFPFYTLFSRKQHLYQFNTKRVHCRIELVGDTLWHIWLSILYHYLNYF